MKKKRYRDTSPEAQRLVALINQGNKDAVRRRLADRTSSATQPHKGPRDYNRRDRTWKTDY